MTDTPAPASADANALDAALFSRTVRRGRDCGELKVGEVRASALIAEFGSPLYVIDETDARERAAAILAAFRREFARVGTEATVYYAGKAFLSIEVARWMSELGLCVDVASGGELAVALAAGVDPATIGFHGNNKSVGEIERAVAAGVGTIVLDSELEIERVAAAAAAAGVRQRVRFRVNSGVHASTHDFLATSHEDQKFGLPLDRAVELAARIRAHDSLDFVGLHCHIGSQIFASDGFRESARRLMGVYAELAEGGPVPELNLGGGFGIAYVRGDEPPVIDEVAAQLADIVRETAEEFGIPLPRVAVEPGRAIIGPAGLTLYTVGTTKSVALDPAEHAGATSRLYVSVDGGMSDNARTALYGAQYSVRLANRRSAAAAQLVRVVGKHCESGDIVVDRDLLPGDVAPGDVLAVPATGAYCWSLASNYNYVGRPPVVAVRDGEARLMIRGETEADLLARNIDWSNT